MVKNSLPPPSARAVAEYFARRTAQAQMIFIPGGFSGGDEPDGSANSSRRFSETPPRDAVTELSRPARVLWPA